MPWIQVRISNVPSNKSENFEDTLSALGAISITYSDQQDQPIFEPEIGETPLWDDIELVGLFDADTDTAELSKNLLTSLPGISEGAIAFEEVADQQWESAWMDQFKAMKFGDRLWVCPHHDIPEVSAPEVIMKLDPGVAFGTGTHPTTHLCLEWLDENIVGSERIIDYGCGSGILAIAALLLGAADAWGTDIDEQAITATIQNAEANEVNTQIKVTMPEQKPNYLADVLVANILANPLISLAEEITSLIKPGGKIALSGILDSQYLDVTKAYENQIKFEPPKFKDEWVLLSGVRIS